MQSRHHSPEQEHRMSQATSHTRVHVGACKQDQNSFSTELRKDCIGISFKHNKYLKGKREMLQIHNHARAAADTNVELLLLTSASGLPGSTSLAYRRALASIGTIGPDRQQRGPATESLQRRVLPATKSAQMPFRPKFSEPLKIEDGRVARADPDKPVLHG